MKSSAFWCILIVLTSLDPVTLLVAFDTVGGGLWQQPTHFLIAPVVTFLSSTAGIPSLQPDYSYTSTCTQFSLPLMNSFRTGQGPCRANLHKWSLARSPSCDCGQRQTLNHTVDACPLTKFEGGLNLLHKADDDSHMAGIYSDCSTCEIILPFW